MAKNTNAEQRYEAQVQRIQAVIRTAKLAGINVDFKLPERPYEIRPQHVKELESITPEQILGIEPGEVAHPQAPTTSAKQSTPKQAKKKASPTKAPKAQTTKAREFEPTVAPTVRTPKPKGEKEPATRKRRIDVVYENLLDRVQINGGQRSDVLLKIMGEYMDKYGYEKVMRGLTHTLDANPGLWDAIINLTHYRDHTTAAAAGKAFDAFGWLLKQGAEHPRTDLTKNPEYLEKWQSFDEFHEPE